MAVLMGMSGSIKGRRYEIARDEVRLGRRDDNDIAIEDSSVSGHHCVVLRDGEKYTLRDMGSTNGTRLNGVSIQEARLKPKDIIQVGAVEVLFDGENVDTLPEERRSTSRIEVLTGPAETPTTFRSASPFGARRDTRRAWLVVVTLIAIAALVMLALLFVRLYQWRT